MSILELTGVSKSYGTNGDRTDVLKDISLSVEEGEFIAIVGFSGSGKTTLMSIIAGLIEADSGTVRVKANRSPDPGRTAGSCSRATR